MIRKLNSSYSFFGGSIPTELKDQFYKEHGRYREIELVEYSCREDGSYFIGFVEDGKVLYGGIGGPYYEVGSYSEKNLMDLVRIMFINSR